MDPLTATEPLTRAQFVEWGLAAALVAVGGSLLVRPKAWIAALGTYASHPLASLLGGLYALFMGIVIVLAHNLWVADARVLVTLVGWVALLTGAVLLYVPEAMAWAVRRVPVTPRLVAVRGFVRVAIGGTIIAYLVSQA